MKFIIIIFVISSILFANVASADFMTGNKLFSILEKIERRADRTSEFDIAMALGYIVGVYDSYEGIFYFTPGGATQGQLLNIVIKYLRENPEILHKPAHEILLEAFKKAFPKEK